MFTILVYIYFSPQVNDTTQLPNTSIERPENGMKKVVKNNGKNKKLKISREIKCPACKAVFPTKESMSLHTCNSILDRHISEEGKERQKIPTVSQNLKTVKVQNLTVPNRVGGPKETCEIEVFLYFTSFYFCLLYILVKKLGKSKIVKLITPSLFSSFLEHCATTTETKIKY